MVSYDTPLEVIEQLRIRIGQYISENSREWSGFNVNIDRMDFQNAIYLIIGVEREWSLDIFLRTCPHVSLLIDRRNWQDWAGRWNRRTEFMRHLKTVLEELEVGYSLPIQPVLLPKHSPFSDSSQSIRPPPDSPGISGADLLGNAAAFRGAEHLYRLPSRGLHA
jgi:hypothetical protein